MEDAQEDAQQTMAMASEFDQGAVSDSESDTDFENEDGELQADSPPAGGLRISVALANHDSGRCRQSDLRRMETFLKTLPTDGLSVLDLQDLPITSPMTKILKTKLCQMALLEELELCGSSCLDNLAFIVECAMSRCQRLKTLSIKNLHDQTPSTFNQCIVGALKMNRTLRKFTLKGGYVNTDLLSYILGDEAPLHGRHLQLESCEFQEGDFNVLVDCLAGHTHIEVTLKNVVLPSFVHTILGLRLYDMTDLRKLCLRVTSGQDLEDVVGEVQTDIPLIALEELRLWSRKVCRPPPELGPSLGAMPNLRTLALHGIDFSDDDMCSLLCDGIQLCQQLRQLHVADCHLHLKVIGGVLVKLPLLSDLLLTGPYNLRKAGLLMRQTIGGGCRPKLNNVTLEVNGDPSGIRSLHQRLSPYVTGRLVVQRQVPPHDLPPLVMATGPSWG